MMITIMQVTTLSQWLINLSQLPPTHGATFWVHLNQIYLCMWNGAANVCLVTGMTSIPRTGEQSKKNYIWMRVIIVKSRHSRLVNNDEY